MRRFCLLFLVLSLFLGSGCAGTRYSPWGISVSEDAPFEVVFYGHKVDRDPVNFLAFVTSLGEGYGMIELAKSLDTWGFVVIQTASIVLDRQKRDRAEMRIRGNEHVLAMIILPKEGSDTPGVFIITDLDPGNPEVKKALADMMKEVLK